MSNRPLIEFECTYCLTRVSAPATECGNQLPCPNCRTALVVPSRSIDLNLVEDIFESLKMDTEPTTTVKPPPNVEAVWEEIPSSPDIPAPLAAPKAGVRPKNVRAGDSEQESSRAPLATTNPRTAKSIQPVPDVPTEELQPLVLEGFDDTDISKVLGIKCAICDTRIHVTEDQVGTKVKCPVCYSKVLVTIPKFPAKTKSNTRWMAAPTFSGTSSQMKMFGDEELQQSPTVELPPAEVTVDPSFGLEPVTDDLLAPLDRSNGGLSEPNSGSDSDAPDLGFERVVAPPPDRSGRSSPTTSPESRREPTRRERYEALQRRQAESENSNQNWLGGSKSKTQKSTSTQPSRRKRENATTNDVEPLLSSSNEVEDKKSIDSVGGDSVHFDFFHFVQIAAEMMGSPGLRWRAAVAAILIGGGSGIMHAIANSYRALEDPQLGNWILNSLLWLGFGGGPYLVGTLLLWFTCGYVFRESALGHRQVFEWTVGGSSDVSSTFLIFSFSFFIAGLPLAFFSFLIMPLRCFLAPPLLVSAWFNQSPFAIVSVDAFQNAQLDWRRWRGLYVFLAALAGLSLFAGLLLYVYVFLLSFLTSMIGASILVFVTIAFASVTGWHCGSVVRGLEKTSHQK